MQLSFAVRDVLLYEIEGRPFGQAAGITGAV
jgi:hypothetical protein